MADEHPWIGTAADYLPKRRSLSALRRAATTCRGCHLWMNATQTVFGEGLRRARLMLVGEQPGDEEDETGRLFAGPSGRLLDGVLESAGIERSDTYVTNVVKHFKWEPRGQRRLHKQPTAAEIGACLPWLEAEIEVLRPEVLLCLGATASRTLLGPGFSVSRQRGEWLDSQLAPHVMATIHPSAILRLRDSAERKVALTRYVAEFRRVLSVLNGAPGDGQGAERYTRRKRPRRSS
jgi:uracil-DNA glycosylase